MRGTVLCGINNIYTVQVNGEAGEHGVVEEPRSAHRLVSCRIKGKVLKGSVGEYNPIAVGDVVTMDPDAQQNGFGLIVGKEPRRSEFVRWNGKRGTPQTIAANVDIAVCVTSALSPPFRPRFIDRVLVSAERGGIRPLILLNKIDTGVPVEVEERLAAYERMGYSTMRCSALTGEGLEAVRALSAGAVVMFTGQSGVGKSSILNALYPELTLSTGAISRKYDRGTHTTNFALLIRTGEGGVVDTPGIREIEIYGIDASELDRYFPDFETYLGECEFSGCTHIHEPGCAVIRAVENGEIHPDRYRSYVRMLDHLSSQ